MQHDVAGNFKLIAVMIAGTVHKQQDEVPGVFFAQDVQKNLEAFGIGRRHDQKDASTVLRADCAIQINIFTNELGGNLWPDAGGCPARPRAVHPAEARFIGEHDLQATTPPGGSPPGFPHSIWKIVFLIAFWAARSRLG